LLAGGESNRSPLLPAKGHNRVIRQYAFSETKLPLLTQPFLAAIVGIVA
jgi:hypothetical protein